MMPAFQRMVALFHSSNNFYKQTRSLGDPQIKNDPKKKTLYTRSYNGKLKHSSLSDCFTLSRAHFAPSIPRNEIRAHIVMILQFFILKSLVSLHLKQLNQECFVIRIIGVDFGGCAVAIVCVCAARHQFNHCFNRCSVVIVIGSCTHTNEIFFIIQKDFDSLPSSLGTEEKLFIFWNASTRWVKMTRIISFSQLTMLI